MSKDRNPNTNLEISHTYSRAQALEDGALIDVTEAARTRCLGMPIAFTQTLYDRFVAVPDGHANKVSAADRLQDILETVSYCIHNVEVDTDEVRFSQHVLNLTTNDYELLECKATCEAGDSMEPVITVKLAEEA